MHNKTTSYAPRYDKLFFMHYIALNNLNMKKLILELQQMVKNDHRDPKAFNHIRKELIKHIKRTEDQFPGHYDDKEMKDVLSEMHDELCDADYESYRISQAHWAHFLITQFIDK